jgi:hypothetical protein
VNTITAILANRYRITNARNQTKVPGTKLCVSFYLCLFLYLSFYLRLRIPTGGYVPFRLRLRFQQLARNMTQGHLAHGTPLKKRQSC